MLVSFEVIAAAFIFVKQEPSVRAAIEAQEWPAAIRCNTCRRGRPAPALRGEDPMAIVRQRHYTCAMNILLLMVVLLLLFGGGGFYLGGPVVGGSGLGLILLVCLVIFLAGGFRTRKG